MNNEDYIKTCSNCGGLQSYTTKSRLKCSIRENWKCNNCSSTHIKKFIVMRLLMRWLNYIKMGLVIVR